MQNGVFDIGGSSDDLERLYERVCGRTRRWTGRIFSVDTLDVELSDGSHGYREIVNHHGGAGVVAVRDGKVCLVRQYRVALGRMTLEIPAGKIDGDESGASCAARELSEETGLTAEELVPLGVCEGAVGFTDEHTEIFLAKGLSQDEEHPDEGEFVNVAWVGFDEALAAVREGRIRDAKTALGLLLAREML